MGSNQTINIVQVIGFLSCASMITTHIAIKNESPSAFIMLALTIVQHFLLQRIQNWLQSYR